MQAFEMKLFIYAETEQDVEECRKAVHAFIEENRKEGRAVTASKLTTALGRWKSNMFLTTITPKVMGKYIKPRTIQQVPPKVINCPNCGK